MGENSVVPIPKAPIARASRGKLIFILQLQTPCRYATQNNEGESMTPITKNEKLTIMQKIFAVWVTIERGFRRETTLPPV
jgi:hypothetical protein